MATIPQGRNRSIFSPAGTVPDVSGALTDSFQKIVFEQVTKTVSGFQVVENTAPIVFHGLIQPLNAQRLLLKPEGQRAWTWLRMYAQPVLSLKVDDVAIWNGKHTRVMAREDYAQYGYILNELAQDWSGSNPKGGS